MIGLIGVELTRYRSRRAIALLVLLAAVFTALVAAKTLWDTRPLSSDEVAAAHAAAATDAQQADMREQIRTCLANPTSVLGPGATKAECRALGPAVHDYYPRARLQVSDVQNGNGFRITVLVVGLLVIAGSTFAGADWASGSIENQLLYESRRSRVWLAKAVAVALASALSAAVLLGGFWLAIGVAARSRGIGPTSHVAWAMAGEAGRGVLLAVAAAVGAYALTMLFRHTVATLALLFAYSIGGEIIVNLLPVGSAARWSLGNNVTGWMRDGFAYFDDSVSCLQDSCSQMVALGHVGAGLFLLVLLLVAAVVSWLVFGRRDA